jgi:hypothetical protein
MTGKNPSEEPELPGALVWKSVLLPFYYHH